MKTSAENLLGPNNPFLFQLEECVVVDSIGTTGTIVCRSELIDPQTLHHVSFYLIETEDQEELNLTQDDLKALNESECNHKWDLYAEDKDINICVKCSKKKNILECN